MMGVGTRHANAPHQAIAQALSRRGKLFALLLGSAVFCGSLAMTAAWDAADARGGGARSHGARSHGSVGRASGGFFGGRSAARPARSFRHHGPTGVRRAFNAGARQAMRKPKATLRHLPSPRKQLARAQRKVAAEKEQFSRNRHNQLTALDELKGRYAGSHKASNRATKRLLSQFRKHGKDSRAYRKAEKSWVRATFG